MKTGLIGLLISVFVFVLAGAGFVVQGEPSQNAPEAEDSQSLRRANLEQELERLNAVIGDHSEGFVLRVDLIDTV